MPAVATDLAAEARRLPATQPETAHLTAEQITADATREELGIGSLDVILLVNNYIQANAPGATTDPGGCRASTTSRASCRSSEEIDQSAPQAASVS